MPNTRAENVTQNDLVDDVVVRRPIDESRPDLRDQPRQQPPRGLATTGRRRGRCLASLETISGRCHGLLGYVGILYS